MENVLITGCSSGFGKATALLLADHGFQVVATTRNKSYSFETPNIQHLYLDMRNIPKSLDDFDVVIFNAGVLDASLIENMDDVSIEEIMEVNVTSIIKMSKMVIPQMKQNRKGKLIFISSMASKRPLPYLSVYNASKSAIEAYAKSLYLELAPYGIEVFILSPGFYKTSLWDKVKKSNDPYEQALNNFSQKNQSNRDVSEIAYRILDICNNKYHRFDSVFSLKDRLVISVSHLIYTRLGKKVFNVIFSETQKEQGFK